MNTAKDKLRNNVSEIKDKLISINDYIHAHPELGRNEFQAMAVLCESLESAGFTVERGTAGLPTAFTAEISNDATGPVVAFIAEYDALPVIGHGCGHNIIATAAVGAAMAIKPLLSELKGTIKVIGTPAEDSTSDKVIMIERGVFNQVDFAMQCHPNDRTITGAEFLALHKVDFKFHGIASHASRAPEKGISALDAVLLTFNAIEYLREHGRKDVSIAGIIDNGGTAANSIPDFASAHFIIRSNDRFYLKETVERVYNCARGAALATGARLDIESCGCQR
jgi:amidohydrolase